MQQYIYAESTGVQRKQAPDEAEPLLHGMRIT